MWKLVFNTETNRGSGFNRSASEGEYEVMLPPSQCAHFAETPERYQYVDGVFGEFAGWGSELEAKELENALTDKLSEIDGVVRMKQNEDFEYQGNMYYSDPDFIHKTLTRIDRLPDEYELTWKTADKEGINNVYVVMTKPEFQAFADFMYDYMAGFWFAGDALKNQVKALANDGDIEAVKAFVVNL